MLTKKEKLKHLMVDILYDALMNGRDYDEDLVEIYDSWFSEDRDDSEVWDDILCEIEDTINEVFDIKIKED